LDKEVDCQIVEKNSIPEVNQMQRSIHVFDKPQAAQSLTDSMVKHLLIVCLPCIILGFIKRPPS